MTPKQALRVVLVGATLGVLPWVSAASAEQRSFEVTASKYKFEPAVLTVDQGDDVTITLKSSDRSHGFEIKEYNVKAEIPEGGGTVKVQFVADKPGTFTFRCSKFCGLGHSKMKGRLIVTPKAQ